MPGTLFVVATPIGNLEDVTVRALRVLREATVIAAEDTRRTARLLARYAITTPTVSLHEHNERTRTTSIIDRLLRGEHVALVSDAGTPTISDPVQALVAAAIEAGLRVEPVPGPNAAVAALAVSGFAGDSFAFLGFPPVRSKDRKQWFARLARAEGIVIFYEAPHRVRRTLADVLDVVGDMPMVVGRELTKAHEELVRGPISMVLNALPEPRGEFTILVDLGHTTETVSVEQPDPADLQSELGELTNNARLKRRAAIGVIARRHGLAPNAVYKILESVKNRS